MFNQKRTPRFLIAAGICVSLVAILAAFLIPQAQPETNAEKVKNAWDLMQEVGQYDFSTTVEQVTYPAASLANVGQSSTKEVYQISGNADLHHDTVTVRMYQQKSSLLNSQDGIEVKIENGKAYGRVIGTEEWDELESYNSTSFTFGDNGSSYLSSATNINLVDTKSIQMTNTDGSSSTVSTVHYSFDVDSNLYARYMRDQMVAELQRSGDLPLGMELSVSDQYREMVSTGELWVTENGMPVRMVIEMKMPPEENGDHIEAVVTTDYFNQNTKNLLAYQPLPAQIAGALGLPRTSEGWREFALNLSVIAVGVVLLGVMIVYSNKKTVYGSVAIVVIVSMLITPLWQGDKYAVFARSLSDQKTAAENEKDAANSTVETWDAHADPMEQVAAIEAIDLTKTTNQPAITNLFKSTLQQIRNSSPNAEADDTSNDTDQDGLTDEYEAQFDISVLNPNLADTDADGLNDGVELKLNLAPGSADSDSDSILDVQEVTSFYYNDQDWFLNYGERDTDEDGQIDGAECPERMNGAAGVCRDTDADGLPDAFDRDDDNDGVPTVNDDSPYVLSSVVFSANSPLVVDFKNLGAKSIFVNYQIVPTNPKHLTYALNVLDWPSGDTDGQVQRISDTTFSSSLTSAQVTADPRSKFGDMRLVPMIEIKLTGSTYPFPLSRSVTTTLYYDNNSSSIELFTEADQPNKTTFKLVSGALTNEKIVLGQGTCDEYTALGTVNLSAVNDTQLMSYTLGSLVNGEHVLVLTDDSSTADKACTVIPPTAHGTMADMVIDSTTLQAYGASIRNDVDGGLLIYAPLAVVYDETGGEPVAFSTKIPYTNAASGFDNSTQQVRMIWMINALTDECLPMPTDYNETDSGTWCNANIPERWTRNVSRAIHTYNEEFKLAGLSVTEDHGVNMAVIFENPATDMDFNYDDALWGMTSGLEHTFLAGRSANGTSLDITVNELQNRFDPDYNAGISDMEKLWGFQKDTFRVVKYSYDTADGINRFISTQAEQIFDNYFNVLPDANRPLSTTLLFVREITQRAVSVGESGASCSGSKCTIDMSGKDVYTQGLINWSPYQRSGDDWGVYDISEYLDTLEARLRDLPDYQPADDSEDARNYVDGLIYVAKIYYQNYYSGVATLVALNGTPVINAPAIIDDGNFLSTFNKYNSKGKLVATVITTVLTMLVDGLFRVPSTLYGLLYGTKTEAIKSVFQAFGAGVENKISPITSRLTSTFRKVMLGIAIVVVVAAFAALAIMYLVGEGTPVGKWANRVLFMAFGIVSVVIAGASLYSAIKAIKAVSDTSKAGAVIGAIIGTIITWGVFFYSWGASGVAFGSLAFNNMLADAIAATCTVVLLAAISATGVGAIVVAIIGLIDGVISAICAIAGAYEQEESHWARQYVCIGISGWITKIFKWVIYSNTYIVNYSDTDRLSFSEVTQDFQNPSLGMVQSNKLKISIGVTNTIETSDLPIDWKAVLYAWQFADVFAKTAAFNYKIQTSEEDIHDDLDRGDTSWTSLGGHKWTKDFTASTDGFSISIPSAGINQDPVVYISEGSAIPVQECWVIYYPIITPFPIPVCYIRTEKDTISTEISSSLTVDVFPSTLDGFYSLAQDTTYTTKTGWKLAWGQSGSVKFPVLRDADGDGLMSSFYTGGNDPNDNAYDTDGDGLSDYYEIANGSDPRKVDTDDDGLPDRQEVLYNTCPTRKDTDGDGLNDYEEVVGWYFTYDFTSTGAPLETMVYPDPNMADTDLDGLTDYLEKVYGFNPQVPQDSDVLDYTLAMREMDAPLIMLQMNEGGGASVFSDSSNFGFSASCTALECPVSGLDGRYAAAASFDGSDVLHISTSAKSVSLTGNQPFTIAAWVLTNSSGTVLSKWSEAATGQRELRFDITSAGTIQLISSTASATSTGTIPYGDWTHIAASFDGSQVTFYINGAAAGTANFSNTPTFAVDSVPQEFLVGAYQGASDLSGYFNGSIDELAFFDFALSEDEILNRVITARYNFNDDLVRPGEVLKYTSTIVNKLNSRFAYGLLTTLIDKTSLIVDWASKLQPTTFVLYPDNPVVTGVNTAEIETELQIDPAATTSEDVTLTQTASAQIVDRRTESNRAELWIKLDETGGATSFVDDSGNMPPRESTCTNCPSSNQDGILNRSVLFNSGMTDEIILPDLSTLNIPNRGYTFSMWVKPLSTSTAGARITLLKSDSNRLAINLVRQSNGSFSPEVLVNNTHVSISSWRNMKASVWSHLVVAYSTMDNKIKVYINGGKVADETTTTITANANLSLGGGSADTGFYVDDLRVFSRQLTTTDINRLAERPVLDLVMDNASFSDASVYGQTVSFINHTPYQQANSVRGTSLHTGTGATMGFLQVSGNSLLDMSDGAFTFSVWIYPTLQNNATWQGVFGYHETATESTAYPSLERKGNQLRFGFGDGSTFQSYETGNILSEYKWNQVVLTFEPSYFESGSYVLKIYVNSVLKESHVFSSKPTAATNFYVGTTSKSYTIHLDTLYMDNEHDAGSHAEPYINEYINGSYTYRPLGEQSMADGDSVSVNMTKTFSNFETSQYEVMEEDSSSADDHCGTLTQMWWYLPPSGTQSLSLSDGFDGSLTYQVSKPSIEFYGYIDELQVYRYALDSEQVYDLFYAIPVTAMLQLDDRPSSTYFENSATVGQLDDGVCNGAQCPAAGTIGLINQAVRFDGADDVITVPLTTTPNYMTSLWVNTTCQNCGLYSLVNGGVTNHQIYMDNGNVCSLVGSAEMCSTGGEFANGQWHHVVYSNDGTTADLWLDGAKVNTLTGSGSVAASTTAKLGYAPAAGNPTLNGQIDDVRVFRYAQSAAVIAALKLRAPIFLVHLDEADGSEVFDDSTPNDFQLVCSGASCPTGGMEGRLTKAVEFNESGDVLTLSQNVLSTSATAFTASLWVYPTDTTDTAQSLITINNAANSAPRYSIAFKAGSMYLTVQNAEGIAVDSIPVSNVELIKNTWNMVTLVVERNSTNTAEYYYLYVNGYLDSSWSGSTISGGIGRITLGNASGFSGLQGGAFIGKLDEVTLYEYALNEIDIRETFAYQMSQVEESSSLTMTVDAENPAVNLVSYNAEFPYMDEKDRVLHVEATDATSAISMVEMQVDNSNAPASSFKVAPVCQDAPGGTAFCPTFIPQYGEGIYSLTFRAVDQVGNQAYSGQYDFLVDATAPKIFANLQNGYLYSADKNKHKKNSWILKMEGRVVDETLSNLPSGIVIPGSGLDLESMSVTVYSENGEIVGSGKQVPTLTPATNGYDWTLNYLFPEAEPTGALTVVIEVKDKVGNLGTKQINILMDASSPKSSMTSNQVLTSDTAAMFSADSLDGKLISGGTVSGEVNDTPQDNIPYITDAGKAAASGVVRVEAGFEPSYDVSYMFNEPYPTGLLAWLPLDNAKEPEDQSGNPDPSAAERYFLDISPFQFSGVCSGENCPINGETGHKTGAIYFDGNEKFINLGQNVDLANRSFSVLVWARRDASGHSDPILWQGPLSTAGQRFLFGVDYNDRVVCGFGGSDLLSADVFNDTGWHAYACTFDLATGTRALYRDGQQLAVDTSAPVPVMNENLYIGYAPVGSFAGSLDELMILDHALDSEQVREYYTWYQAVYHLTVDEKFLANGDTVNDSSGYFQRGTLVSGEGDDLNKVVAGAVGNYALTFDGNDKLAVNDAFSLSLDRGAFTQSVWIKPASGAGAAGVISEFDENPEMRYPSIYLTGALGLTAGFGNFYDWHEFSSADNVLTADTWNLVTARFDGTTYSLFVNGVQVAETEAMSGLQPYPATRFNIGDGFVGEIDDVRVFARALSDGEINAMAMSGWRTTSLNTTGGITSWTANVLPGLEGPYRVDVRGWDAFNHFETSWSVDHQWSGVVDTLAPRLTYTMTMDPDDPYLAHYSFEVTDIYLDDTSIHQNICDNMVVTREYFNTSWMLSMGVPPNTRLYRLTGSCSSDIRTYSTTGFYACDTAGNCSMKEYEAYYKYRTFLPSVSGGGANLSGNLTPALPEKLSQVQVEKALGWKSLAESIEVADGGQAPQLAITTDELTPADARNWLFSVIKGAVADDSAAVTVTVEILQNGAVIYSTPAAVYDGLWNAVWTYLPGGQPANGNYTIRATAVDGAGNLSSVEREIYVHLLP